MAELKYIYHVPRYFVKLSHYPNGKTIKNGETIKVNDSELRTLLKTYKSFFVEIKEPTRRVKQEELEE